MQRKKKIALWTTGILLSPVLLFLFVAFLLYLPPVQQWAVRRVAAYASEQTGYDISLERVRLKFLCDLDLQKLYVVDQPDTLLSVEHVVVDLDFRHILDGRLGVEALDIQDGTVNTKDLIATVLVKGHLGNFHLNADDISLNDQVAELTAAQLDGCDVDISMRDTTVVDTTESAPIMWRLKLGDISVTDTRIAFHTVGDSICVRGGVKRLRIRNGDIDLGQGIYRIAEAEAEADSLAVHLAPVVAQNPKDTNIQKKTINAFDPKHLMLRDVRLVASAFAYSPEELRVYLSQCEAKEQSGLQICELTSHVILDSLRLQLPDLVASTAHSSMTGAADIQWSALTPHEGGRFTLDTKAQVGRGDVEILVPEYAQYFSKTEPAVVDASLEGNVDTLDVKALHVMFPPMIDAKTNGRLTSLLETDDLGADLQWDVQTYDLGLVHQLAGLGNDIHLPQMHIKGGTTLHGPQYTADLSVRQGNGLVKLKADYNTQTEAYHAQTDIRDLQLHNFLPHDSIFNLTAKASVDGRGTDYLSHSTTMNATAEVEHLRYAHYDIDNTRANARLRDGKGLLEVDTDNKLLTAQACAEADIDKEISLADFSLDLQRIDLQGLGLVEKPFVASMLMHVDGNSNLKDSHQVSGGMQAIEFVLADTTVHPLDLHFALDVAPDTLFAMVNAGDLELELYSHENYNDLLNKANAFVDEAMRQYEKHEIDQPLLKSLLPTAKLHLKSGARNPICNMLIQALGYSYESLSVDMDANPIDGLRSDGKLLALNTGAIQLDDISWHLYQDSTGVVNMAASVKNGPQNQQVAFQADLNANLTATGAGATITFRDADGDKGLDLGGILNIEDEGLRLHLYPLNPIIAYRSFSLNNDNFIYLRNDKHLEANVDLLADDGTGFKLYSTPNEDALQDITLSVHNFNLGELSSVVPYMPDVRGLLAGDFHLVQDEHSMSVSVDAQVGDLVYEGTELGTVGLNAMYLPNEDGTHYVDGIVSRNGDEVMLLSGTYDPAGSGSIDAQAQLQRLPLTMVNGFIPDGVVAMDGYVVGELAVTGPVSAPILNGNLCTDSMRLNSDQYSVHLRFPDDTLVIQNSRINLNRIEAYSSGKRPLVLDGTLDFRNLNRIAMNLNLDARNFELINAPKTRRALAYGKVFVNLDANLSGTLDDARLRGSLKVLGNTDVTYVLADSPLTIEDQLADLVTFVDFRDTTHTEPVETASPQNIDMQMNIGIEQAAQVHCLLSEDGTNYVDLEGGGDLQMTYTNRDGLKMFGRYTIVSGEINYVLMVMALKNVAIESGSYVEFTGDMLNPRLSISATERMKTTVYENSVPRSVVFEVGMQLSQTLENMGMEFVLEAPEDLTISNQLATMSADERGKVAVTMLATGMYLTDDGSTNGFSGTNALNTFLQNQISAISNKALGSIDLNFGMDNTNTASGALQTDYNFSFAKRFWGNRISLIIGGKVSSGNEAQNTGQSIIDNVSIEYRLDKSATRYVRLYYDRGTESLMEGEIMEMGAGVVFRKKSTRLGELFIFRKKKK